MTAQICVLASGSKGNCTYISDGTTHLLIDAGISCRRIEQELSALGQSLSNITAILVTHEHIDHVYGLHTLEKKYSIPILANQRTATSVDVKMSTHISRYCRACFDTGFSVGGIKITPFRTLHDAVCSVGYALEVGGHRVAYVTDLGTVTESVRQNVLGSELVILESNHDVHMLETGPYPPELQARVRGDQGHLNNVQSASFACELVSHGATHIVLAHISENNNTPELALKTSRSILRKKGIDKEVALVAAGASCATKLIQL